MDIAYEVPRENIVYFPGILSNIDNLIASIEQISSIAISPWEVWYASSDTSGYAYGEVKFMNRQLLERETDLETKALSDKVITTLISAMSVAAKTYADIYDVDQESLKYALDALEMAGTKYGINKYYENMYMGPHVDWNEQNSDITYTIVVYLNDDYEGGELYFLDPKIDLKIKPKKGSIVMFPSVLPYLHQSCEITSGRKMLITHHWKNNSLVQNM